jgi:hypothetical protein
MRHPVQKPTNPDRARIVFANNPALCAYAEARKIEFSKLKICQIKTIAFH